VPDQEGSHGTAGRDRPCSPRLIADHADHAGRVFAYFLDVPFAETLRRHATKPERLTYGEAEMRQWYRGRDLLPGGIERVIPPESSLDDTVRTIMADAGLGACSRPDGRSRTESQSV
jgi:hypothetical protein